MANTYPYAQKWATNKQLSQAYYEYTTAIVKDYGAVVSMFESVIENSETISDIDSYIDNYFVDMNLELNHNTGFIYNDAVYSLSEFSSLIIDSVNTELTQIEGSGLSNIDPEVELSNGNKTLSEVLNDIQATFHSSVVEAAAAQAIAYADSSADKLSLFRDYISQRFVSAYTDISNTIESIAEEIKTNINVRSFIAERFDRMGITSGKNTGILTDSYDETYTGSSSACAALLHSAKDLAVSTAHYIKAACNTILTVFDNLIKGAANLIIKAGKFIDTHLFNPLEVEYIGKEGSGHVFDKFFIIKELDVKDDQYSYIHDQLLEGPVHLDFCFSEVVIQFKEDYSGGFVNLVTTFTGGMNYLKNYADAHWNPQVPSYLVGEDYISTLIRWLNQFESASLGDPSGAIQTDLVTLLSYMYPGESFSSQMTILELLQKMYYIEEYPSYHEYAEVMLKVKPVDYFKLGNACYTPTGTSYDAQTVIAAIENVSNNSNLYAINDQTKDNPTYNVTPEDVITNYEVYLYNCCLFSMVYAYFELYLLNKESQGYNLDEYSDPIYYDFNMYSYFHNHKAYQYVNRDFLLLITDGKIKDNDEDITLTLPYYSAIGIINNVLSYRAVHSLEYPFYPYTTKNLEWNQPSWAILCDARVQSELETWITRAIVIIAVAIVAIKVFKKVKLGLSKLQYLAAGAEWNATEAASKGILTPQLLTAARKASFKYKVAGYLTGGILTATTAKVYSGLAATTNNGEVSVDLSPIVDLIKGDY